MPRPIGLVLAGGQGRRMGRTKGDMTICGRRLATHAAHALVPLCRGVLISLQAGSDNPAPGFPAVEDAPPPGRGPLAGIRSGFDATDEADLLVLACDYPNVKTDLLRLLLEAAERCREADLVIAVDSAGRDHPLVGLWRRGSAGRVREALEGERFKVLDLVRSSRVVRVTKGANGSDLDHELVNLNSPSDVEGLEG